MITEQLRVASTVIASVPSEKYCFPQGLRGDERLMDADGWKKALAPFNTIIEYYGENPGEEFHHCITITGK